MNDRLTFQSDSKRWFAPHSDIQFTLHEHHWTRSIGTNEKNRYTYDRIIYIRLNYIYGGNSAPNKFGCTILTDDGETFTFTVLDTPVNKQKIASYREFVLKLIEKTKLKQPLAKLRIGHARVTYRFMQVMLTIITLLFFTVLIFFMTKEGRKEIKIPAMLFIIPSIAVVFLGVQIFYLRKHKPYSLSLGDSIPDHVFPKSNE